MGTQPWRFSQALNTGSEQVLEAPPVPCAGALISPVEREFSLAVTITLSGEVDPGSHHRLCCRQLRPLSPPQPVTRLPSAPVPPSLPRSQPQPIVDLLRAQAQNPNCSACDHCVIPAFPPSLLHPPTLSSSSFLTHPQKQTSLDGTMLTVSVHSVSSIFSSINITTLSPAPPTASDYSSV